jgi:hypothetical protein
MTEWFEGFWIGIFTALLPSMIFLAIMLWNAPTYED